MLQVMFSPIGFVAFTMLQVVFIGIITLLKKSKLSLFILTISITIIGVYIGFANRWGYDSIHYYIPLYDGDTSRQFEPGFTLLIYGFRAIGIPSDLFPVVTMVIAVWVAFIAILKLTNEYKQTAIIALCLTSMISFMYLYMGGMRQAISFSFVLLSIVYQSQKRPIKYYISIAIAIALHFSALVFLIIPIWRRVNFKKKYTIILLSLIFALISEYLVGFILKILPPGSIFTDKMIRAFEYSDRNSEHVTYIYKFLFSTLFIFIPIFLGLSKVVENKNATLIFEYALLSYVFSALLFFTKESSIRYLFAVNILLVSFYIMCIEQFFVKSQKTLVTLIIVLFFLMYSFLSHNWLSNLVMRFIE